MGSQGYSQELRERAVAMVGEVTGDHGSEFAAICHVAELLGITTPETLRRWVRQERTGLSRMEPSEFTLYLAPDSFAISL